MQVTTHSVSNMASHTRVTIFINKYISNIKLCSFNVLRRMGDEKIRNARKRYYKI
jgi:hypothetical protein